jgi:hypothetical protein
MLPGAQTKRLPRPTAGVTADRLAYALDRWPEQFTQEETTYARALIARLNQIAEDNKRCPSPTRLP